MVKTVNSKRLLIVDTHSVVHPRFGIPKKGGIENRGINAKKH